MENILVKKEIKSELIDELYNFEVVYRTAQSESDTESERENSSKNSAYKRVICKMPDIKPKIEQLPPILDSTYCIEKCAVAASGGLSDKTNEEIEGNRNDEGEMKICPEPIKRSEAQIDTHSNRTNKKQIEIPSTVEQTKLSQKRPLKRIYRKEEILIFMPSSKKFAESKTEALNHPFNMKTLHCDRCDRRYGTLKMLLAHRRVHTTIEWQSIPNNKNLLELPRQTCFEDRTFNQSDLKLIDNKHSEWLLRQELAKQVKQFDREHKNRFKLIAKLR